MRTNLSPEEQKADRQTQAFLEQCERDGKLTAEELAEIRLDRGASGDSKPERLIRFADFVQTVCQDTDWSKEDAKRYLMLHLEEVRLTPRYIELYLNYPARTQKELARMFGMKERTVGHYLSRVRKVWPALRLDGTKRCGIPDFDKMRGFVVNYRNGDSFDNSDELLDESRIVKF
jgi:DNA-binding CsgD family transcriptional regulator